MDKDQTHRLIDFALDILHGCKHSCYGCNVNKIDQEGFKDNDLQKLEALFLDLKQKNYVLATLSVGPTDFMAANNTEAMMKLIGPLMDQFHAVVLQSTFIYSDEELKHYAQLMLPFLKGRKIKLGFPVEPKHLNKEKYVETIIRNIDYFCSLLPGVEIGKVFAILNLKQYANTEDDPINNVERMVQFFRSRRVDFDMVVTEGRLNLDDLNNKEKLKQSFLYVKKIQDLSAFSKGVYNLLTLSTYYREAVQLYSVDSQGRKFVDLDFVYKNGKIYNTVFSGEAVALFHDSLSIDNSIEWNELAILHLRDRILTEQLEFVDKTNSCLNCEFVSSCMEKGFLQVMKIVGTKECIVSKSSFERNRNTLESNTYCKADCYDQPL